MNNIQEKDIEGLLISLRQFGTQQVVMSGGEALLNPNFFTFCAILKQENIRITLLSTGLTIKRHAEQLIKWVDDLIVSIDGDEKLHDTIRNIPGAFNKLKEGVAHIRSLNPAYRITGRSVIHKLNFKNWPAIIDSALEMGLNQVSFLPADVSSNAFNRTKVWDETRQADVQLSVPELAELQVVTDYIIEEYKTLFNNKFIAETPEKLQKIVTYYSALHGLNSFPYKKCNAPWVSTVIEADGSVRPCFFHDVIGNIREATLETIVNGEKGFQFRKQLNMHTNDTCIKCVCYLNLSPSAAIA